MRQTGHKRTETLDIYIRPATVFKGNSTSYAASTRRDAVTVDDAAEAAVHEWLTPT